MDKIYLIFKDSADDLAEFKGVIIGTEEQAKQYCEDYNKNCQERYEMIQYEEVENLSKPQNDKEEDEDLGEWIEGGDWLLFCSKCDREIEDKDTDEYPAFCPWCGKKMKKEVRRS